MKPCSPDGLGASVDLRALVLVLCTSNDCREAFPRGGWLGWDGGEAYGALLCGGGGGGLLLRGGEAEYKSSGSSASGVEGFSARALSPVDVRCFGAV